VVEVKTTVCNTSGGPMSSGPVTENMASSSKDQPSLPVVAPRALFPPPTTRVSRTMEKSSLGLVGLSREMRPPTSQAKANGIYSDSDVPLATLLKRSKVPRSGSKPQSAQAIAKYCKRKTEEFSRSSSESPKKELKPRQAVKLPEFGKKKKWNKFGNVPMKKLKIKQEFPSDGEHDPTGSSGAEVKGDSDYEQSSDTE
jgi:hypothetical protein